MRWVLGVVVATVAWLGSVIVGPGPACACSCAALAPESVVQQASLVVVGTPVSATRSGPDVSYEVDVIRSYKQAVPQRITVSSPFTSAACGVDPELGVERILVLRGGDGVWSANLCGNLSVTADTLQVAGAPIAPIVSAPEAGPPTTRTAAIAGRILGGVLILAGLGYWMIRRFRRRDSSPNRSRRPR